MTALAIIISVVAVGIVSIHMIRQVNEESMTELMSLTCEKSKQDLDVYLNSIEQCVDTVAFFAEDEISGLSDDQLHEYIKDVDVLFRNIAYSTEGIITYYYRIDPEISMKEQGFWFQRMKDGNFKAADEMTDITKYDPHDMEHVGWYYIPKVRGSSSWLSPYVNKNLNNTKMISYVAPIYWKGKFIGVLGIDYDYEAVCEHLKYKGTFRSGEVFLIGDNDTVVFHPEFESGTDVSDICPEMSKRNLSKTSNVLNYSENGVKKIAAWSTLANGMNLFASVDEKEVDSVWQGMIIYFILALLAILAVFIVIVLYSTNRLTRPLTNLTEAARKMDEGDYNIELDYDGDDEIGVLTRSFRQLVKHLQAYITDLNDKAYKDSLTSLKNKSSFDMFMLKLDDRISVAENAEDTKFAICMFDSNSLKEINDNYGHDKGDIYLQTSCDLICSVFSHSPVFRIGGDEFVSVLQGDNYEKREELCSKFDELAVKISEKTEEPWKKIDMACGIAVYDPKTDRTAGDVLKRADANMYNDKAQKKNKGYE